MGIKKVRALTPGCTIGVVGTGVPLAEDRVKSGVAELERRGYSVRMPLDPAKFYADYTHGFTNGSALERAQALKDLLNDDEVTAILAARGGYGGHDLLDLLDYSEVRNSGKCIVGMSDVSILLGQWLQKAGLVSIHGITLGSSLADAANDSDAARSVDSCLRMLSDPSYLPQHTCRVLRAGVSQGVFLAGNLSIFTSLLGTPWDIDFDGKILVLEDVGEPPYRIERSLMHLKLAGKLDGLSGLVFGRFSKCVSAHGPSVEEVIENFVSGILRKQSYPVLCDFAFGHWGENQAIPLGCAGTIDNDTLKVSESAIAD